MCYLLADGDFAAVVVDRRWPEESKTSLIELLVELIVFWDLHYKTIVREIFLLQQLPVRTATVLC